jgi:bifunctional DNase/RNase
MTHDLFKNFTEMLDISVAKVEVCDLRENTFYARIYFVSEKNNFDMDARPSDAIALALRYDAPIFVEDSVMQKSKMPDGEMEVMDTLISR